MDSRFSVDVKDCSVIPATLALSLEALLRLCDFHLLLALCFVNSAAVAERRQTHDEAQSELLSLTGRQGCRCVGSCDSACFTL